MKHRIENKDSFIIVGIQKSGSGNDNSFIPELWANLHENRTKITTSALPPIFIGYGEVKEDFMETGAFSYTAGLIVDTQTDIPEGMVKISIPENEYAVFEIDMSDVSNIPKQIQQIYFEYLPGNGLAVNGLYDFEYYTDQSIPNQAGSTYFHYIPVKKI